MRAVFRRTTPVVALGVAAAIAATMLVADAFAASADPAQSTIVASAGSVLADGNDSSTITVTLLDADGSPVAGKTVTLGAASGSSSISAASGPSDASGVVTFTVTDDTAETVSYRATDASDAVTIAGTASVTFTREPDPTLSTVWATPTAVAADGASTSTVTVTLEDGYGPLPGRTVALSQGAGHSTITTTSSTSDSSGAVVFTVVDSTAETVTYTAEDTTDGVAIDQTADIAFGTIASQSTVAASPTRVPADGVSSSTVTVTLDDALGSALPGKTVTLRASGGSSTVSAASGPSDSNGVVTFTVEDSTAESVTYTAEDTTDGAVVAQTASVTFTSTAAHPTAFAVDTAADTHDASPGDGACADTGGRCSLRAAIEESDAACNGVTITLPAGTYTLSLGELSLTCGPNSIAGAGARATVIEQTASQRVLEVDAGSDAVSGVTITGGDTSSSGSEPNHGVGGGIWIDSGGALTVADSAVSGNSATDSGGGIDDDGTLTVVRSTIANDTASGGPGDGGGIDDFGAALTVTDSTIADDTAGTSGGGVFLGAAATFVNDTIASNSAPSGGGLAEDGEQAVGLTNVIVSGNAGGDCEGSVVSYGIDLSSDTSCDGFTARDLQGVDPQLGALRNNGGGTDTMAPATTSPAVDAGDDSGCPSTDQRGVSRPQGAHCDIGAVELAAAVAPATVSASASTVQASPGSVAADGTTAATITVTLGDGSGSPVSGKTVTLSASGGGSTVSAASGPSDGSGVVTFTVTDATVETLTYSATDATDGIALTQTATVAFTAAAPRGTVSATRSTIAASPATISADGGATAHVTVTLEDANGRPVGGDTVRLSQGGGHSKIAPGVGTSDGSGVVVFTVSSTTPETDTYSALDTTAGVTLHETVTVTFASLAPQASFTVSLRGADASFDASASTPGGGSIAAYAWDFGDGTQGTGVRTGHTYQAAGTYAVKLTVTTSGGATGTLTKQIAVASAGPDVGRSTISLSRPSAPANGTTPIVVTVTLRDSAGLLLRGWVVSLAAGRALRSVGAAGVAVRPSRAGTGPDGAAVFDVTGSSPAAVRLTARVQGTPGFSLSAEASFFSGSLHVAMTSEPWISPDARWRVDVTGAPPRTKLRLEPTARLAHFATVQLVPSPGEQLPPAGETDSEGRMSWLVTGAAASPNPVAIAIVDSAGDVFDPMASLDFDGRVSASRSAVTVQRGASTDVVTVTLRDASGAALPGKKIGLDTAGHASSPAPVLTGASGVAKLVVRDAYAENVRLVASDWTDAAAGCPATRDPDACNATGDATQATTCPGGGQALCHDVEPTDVAHVTLAFGGLAVAARSSVQVSPSLAEVGEPVTVDVTLRDAAGTGLAGKRVQLFASGQTSPAASGVTDSTGRASIVVGPRQTAGTIVYSVLDATDGVALTQKATASWADPGVPDAARSTMIVGAASETSDGTRESIPVSIVVRDAFGSPVAAAAVAVTDDADPNVSGTCAPPCVSAVTDANGAVTIPVTDSALETATVTVVAGDPAVELGTEQLTFAELAGLANALQSTISSSPADLVLTDGVNASTVTVTLLDNAGKPVAGKSVSITQGAPCGTDPRCSASIVPQQATTNGAGRATFSVTDLYPQDVPLSARDVTDGVALFSTATVQFVTASVTNAFVNLGSVPAGQAAFDTEEVVTNRTNIAFDGWAKWGTPNTPTLEYANDITPSPDCPNSVGVEAPASECGPFQISSYDPDNPTDSSDQSSNCESPTNYGEGDYVNGACRFSIKFEPGAAGFYNDTFFFQVCDTSYFYPGPGTPYEMQHCTLVQVHLHGVGISTP